MNLKQRIFRNLLSIPGWRTNRKIVVIESDDWGSIRMPSKSILKELQTKGFQPENDPYLKYDCLESNHDLTHLFEILQSVKDKHGEYPKITANVLVANPDFDRIKKADFQSFFHESVTDTFDRYQNHDQVFNLWKEGIANQIFYPQFHGREHLNVDRWMLGLQAGDPVLHEAFKRRMISISSIPSSMKFGYMEGLDYFSEEEKLNKGHILAEGLKMFKKLLGYHSKSFIANCYIWDDGDEKITAEHGVKYIQGMVNQIKPMMKNNQHSHRYIKHFFGQRNTFGQYYMIRNAHFEPSLIENFDIIDDCLNRMNIAFSWKKPVIICAHRVNFIGSIDVTNREKNLKKFAVLLKRIVTKWPDVEFMTTENLGDLISSDS